MHQHYFLFHKSEQLHKAIIMTYCKKAKRGGRRLQHHNKEDFNFCTNSQKRNLMWKINLYQLELPLPQIQKIEIDEK